MYSQLGRHSHQDLIKSLEADIQHANALAAAISRSKSGALIQMKLVYGPFAPLLLVMLQWVNCSCTCLLPRYMNLFHILIYKVHSSKRTRMNPTYRRKATLRDFYAVILPSLERLHDDLEELENVGIKEKKANGDVKFTMDFEDECSICLEPCTKMVLPNCYHEMCIKCYRNWSMKSESCPFCRGSLKRVKSGDLWVLTREDDVVDPETVSEQNLQSFYLYLNSLPQDCPEAALFLLYYEHYLY